MNKIQSECKMNHKFKSLMKKLVNWGKLVHKLQDNKKNWMKLKENANKIKKNFNK